MTLTLNGVDLNQPPDWDFSWTLWAPTFSGTVADDTAYSDLLTAVAEGTRAPRSNRYWLLKDGAGYAVGVKFYRSGSKVTARLCCPTRSDETCTDVLSTFAPEDFTGQVPWVGGHWYAGGIDTNPHGEDPDRPAGNYYFWHSLSNPWAGYAFEGTWTAGRSYKVGFWSRVYAGPCTFYLGSAGIGSGSPMNADSVSVSVATEAEWTHHELTWTPASTVVSDGAWDHAGVKLHMSFAASSTEGVAFDGDSLCET